MKIRKLKIENWERGYSVLELLFYIALFTVLALAVINAMITMTKSLRESAVHNDLMGSAQIMERISREIRQSYAISSIGANNLRLSSKDAAGAERTAEIAFSGGNIQFLENGVPVSNLNSPNIAVADLSFTEITSAKSKAVRAALTLSSVRDSLNRQFVFYDTVVLRGDYE